MPYLNKKQQRYAKKAFKTAGRMVYKTTGMVNPIKKGKVSTSRLIKDVAILKGIINSEKFRVETQPMNDTFVGQINGNSSGHYLADWTPLPSQGDGYNNRQGNSIRYVSSHISMLIQRQANSNGPCNIKIQLIKVIGEAYSSASNVLGKFIEPDRWVNGGTVYDTASDRKPEYFKQYRVLLTKNVYFKDVNYTGSTTQQQKIINFGLKLKNHHVKWNNNSNTLADGQILCLITCDAGNCSTATASTLDSVVQTQINSGFIINANKMDYYYDN